MRNEVHLKTVWYRLCENAWFPWQHPYMVFENGGGGVGVQIQSYLGFYAHSSFSSLVQSLLPKDTILRTYSAYPRALKLVSN